MDQYLDNNLSEFLQTLLANPVDGTDSYADNLKQLVDVFPQSGVLHALLARHSEEKDLQRAATYFSPASLYKLIKAPTALSEVAFEKIKIQAGILAGEPAADNENLFTGVTDEQQGEPAAELSENYFSEQLVADEETEEHLTDQVLEDSEENTLTEIHTDESAEQENEVAEEDPVEDTLAETLVTEMPESEIEDEDEIAVEDQQEETDLEEPGTVKPENEALENNLVEDALAETQVSEMPESETEEFAEMPVEDDRAEQGLSETYEEEPEITVLTDDLVEDTLAETQISEMPESETEELSETPVEDYTAASGTTEQQTEPVEETIGYADEVVSDEVTESVVEEQHEVVDDQSAGEPIDDEVFEEIGTVEVPAEIEQHAENLTEEHKIEQDESAIETEKLIMNNIAGADFFMFDSKFRSPVAEEVPPTIEAPETLPTFAADTDSEEVSKYHDDKMPYTFMWWLNKTRKEHVGIYQPYAQPPAVAADTANELQQQYYENIFHLSSTDDLEKSTSTQTIQFDMKRPEHVKEHQIIERFLKEEPQIKPQSSDKLDNENKAKRSAEDRDEEIITETLAIIYTDQMLYHKAIATYKKLLLKFPEKSVYFAGKIEQLEKKTN